MSWHACGMKCYQEEAFSTGNDVARGVIKKMNSTYRSECWVPSVRPEHWNNQVSETIDRRGFLLDHTANFRHWKRNRFPYLLGYNIHSFPHSEERSMFGSNHKIRLSVDASKRVRLTPVACLKSSFNLSSTVFKKSSFYFSSFSFSLKEMRILFALEESLANIGCYFNKSDFTHIHACR